MLQLDQRSVQCCTAMGNRAPLSISETELLRVVHPGILSVHSCSRWQTLWLGRDSDPANKTNMMHTGPKTRFLISLQRDRAVDMSITTSVKWLVSQSELYPLGPITLGKSGRAALKKCLTPTHVSIGLNWNSATRDWHTQEVKLFLASHATKQEWTGLCVWCHIKISPCWILDKERRSYRARFVKKMDEHNGFVSLLTEITRSLSSINVSPPSWTQSQAKWIKWNKIAIVSNHQAKVWNACSLTAMHPPEALFKWGPMLNWWLWKTDTQLSLWELQVFRRINLTQTLLLSPFSFLFSLSISCRWKSTFRRPTKDPICCRCSTLWAVFVWK